MQVMKGMKSLALYLEVTEQPFLFVVLFRGQWKTLEFVEFLRTWLVPKCCWQKFDTGEMLLF